MTSKKNNMQDRVYYYRLLTDINAHCKILTIAMTKDKRIVDGSVAGVSSKPAKQPGFFGKLLGRARDLAQQDPRATVAAVRATVDVTAVGTAASIPTHDTASNVLKGVVIAAGTVDAVRSAYNTRRQLTDTQSDLADAHDTIGNLRDQHTQSSDGIQTTVDSQTRWGLGGVTRKTTTTTKRFATGRNGNGSPASRELPALGAPGADTQSRNGRNGQQPRHGR